MRPPRLHRPSSPSSATHRASFLVSRVVSRPGTGLLVSALLLGSACIAGCQSKQGTAATVPDGAGASGDRVPVEPAWQKFAEENYYGVVQAGLPARSMVSAKFPRKPTVVASRGKSGKIDLVAIGDVETTGSGGKRTRYPASVMWQQRGSGWEMVFRDIGAGSDAPTPPATAPAPTMVPATRPAAPGAAPPAP
jgi:hypothetical protein